MSDTRSDRCQTCNRSTAVFGRLACELMGLERHCCGEDLTLPSPGMLATAWADPAAKCPHPRGDRWQHAQLVPLIVSKGIASAGWLAERAGGCMRCAKHLGEYRCAAKGGDRVNSLVLDRAAHCPDEPPVWTAVPPSQRGG